MNQNSIREKVVCRLQSGNACYYSLQNHLSSSLLSKNIKVTIYRTIWGMVLTTHPHLSAKVMKGWGYTSTHPLGLSGLF